MDSTNTTVSVVGQTITVAEGATNQQVNNSAPSAAPMSGSGLKVPQTPLELTEAMAQQGSNVQRQTMAVFSVFLSGYAQKEEALNQQIAALTANLKDCSDRRETLGTDVATLRERLTHSATETVSMFGLNTIGSALMAYAGTETSGRQRVVLVSIGFAAVVWAVCIGVLRQLRRK